MKIWIHLNGVQEGPFEKDELPLYRMSPDTPVWHEGLPDWMPASRVAATAPLFAGMSVPASTAPAMAMQAAAPYEAETEQPATSYFVWMLVLTVLFFNPVGIIGIITSLVVRHRNRTGDFAGARKMSEVTAWILMVCIVMAIMRPLTLLI